MTYEFDEGLRETIARNLLTHKREEFPAEGMRLAAVAIVIAPHIVSGEACFWLTRRTQKLRRHSGQFALPGGRIDSGETPCDAALRELQEEMGVTLRDSNILGALDDFVTRSGFRITPFVMWADDNAMVVPDPVEVAHVFHVPLADLDNPAIPLLVESDEPGRHIMSAPLASLGHAIYAPTAAMLYQFKETGLHGRATRVAHFDQPMFARQ